MTTPLPPALQAAQFPPAVHAIVLPPTLRAAIDKEVEKKTPYPRKDSQFKAEETVLSRHKEEYIRRLSREDREAYFKSFILVDVFDYWYKKGEVKEDISDEELSARIKTLVRWITNNWRRNHKVSKPLPERKKSTVDIVWLHWSEKVREEIKLMLLKDGEDRVLTGQEYFTNRTTACKRIFEKMTPAEKASVLIKAQTARIDANPVDIQRKRAEKYAHATVAKHALSMWRDMGLQCVIFYAYTRQNGKVEVAIHDKMAAHANTTNRRFLDMYSQEVQFLQRKLADYMKSLQDPIHLAPPKTTLDLEMENGFPVMPEFADPTNLKKDDLENIIRRYLNVHYKLASGMVKSHVPFSKFTMSPNEFIDNRYYPLGFSWKDPRNMTKSALLDFSKFIRERQEKYGPRNAFRFQKYYNGKNMVTSEYGFVVEDQRPAERAKKQNARRKKEKGKKKGKGKTKESAHEISAAMNDELRMSADDMTADTNEQDTQVSTHLNIPANDSNDESKIDPRLRGQGGITVTDAQMQVLLSAGYAPVPPINGPNDGPPQYHVPYSALDILKDIENPETNDTSSVRPKSTRPKPRRTSKKVRFQPHDTSGRSLRGQQEPVVLDAQSGRSLRSQGKTAGTSKSARVAKRKWILSSV